MSVTHTAPSQALLSADAVAEMLGVPRSWVYANTASGVIPAVRLGRYRRYRREAIEAFIADREGRDS